MNKFGVFAFTVWILLLGIASLSHAQQLVVINGKHLHPSELADLERRCGPILNGVYRVPGDRWWNVMNPAHAGSVSQLCDPNRQHRNGHGVYQQGSSTGEVYKDGASAHRNFNISHGAIINPNGGGHWKDRVFISR